MFHPVVNMVLILIHGGCLIHIFNDVSLQFFSSVAILRMCNANTFDSVKLNNLEICLISKNLFYIYHHKIKAVKCKI